MIRYFFNSWPNLFVKGVQYTAVYWDLPSVHRSYSDGIMLTTLLTRFLARSPGELEQVLLEGDLTPPPPPGSGVLVPLLRLPRTPLFVGYKQTHNAMTYLTNELIDHEHQLVETMKQ